MVSAPTGFQNFDPILIFPILGCPYFFSVHFLKRLFFVGCCNHDSFRGTGSTEEFFSLQSSGRRSTFFPIHILVLQILASYGALLRECSPASYWALFSAGLLCAQGPFFRERLRLLRNPNLRHES